MHPYSIEVVFDQDTYQGFVLAPLPTRISLVLVGAVLLQKTNPTRGAQTCQMTCSGNLVTRIYEIS